MTSSQTGAGGLSFQRRTLPQRVLFGTGQGAQHLRAEMTRMGAARPMVIGTPSASVAVRRLLAGVEVAVWFDEVVQHVPVDVAKRAREAATGHRVDLLVSVGGGSATGLAKAVALNTGLPIMAVPTTYAGSEVTDVWGLTEDGRKTTGQDDRVLPRVVVYDAELTVAMPVELSVVSGLNALAHCIDSLWAPATNPVSDGLATEGTRLLAQGLPIVADAPRQLAGREQVLAGAYLAALAFTEAGSGLHHKICHVLGGRFDLPHAPLHAVVLPHVLAFNGAAAPAAIRRVAEALGAQDATSGLSVLYRRLGAPRALRELGMPADGLDEAVELVLGNLPRRNPRPVDRDDLAVLLRAAWAGEWPTADGQPT